MNDGEDDAAVSVKTPVTSVVARLATDAAAARDLVDRLAEDFDSAEAAVSAYETNGGGWSVDIHFHNPPNETAVRALVALTAGAGTANALVFEKVATRDWVKASLDGLAPVQAGRFVVHGAHDRSRAAVNRIGIEIEAALAFGTGHHGTTRGCLLALDGLVRAHRPKRILDLGTGTGVLAIAAARAAHGTVLASDVDPRCVETARENARLNRAHIEVIRARGLGARRLREAGRFDLVLANILLAPLQRLAKPMADVLAPGGHVVLSGLLTSHAHAALASYRAQGLALTRRIVLQGWTTLVLRDPAYRSHARGAGKRM